jgi:organic hydroperoxide reductase OsmC/OhrA
VTGVTGVTGVHTATIEWTREGDFADNQYSRAHTWRFDGGLSVPASSSPHVVSIPYSNPANVDPEEAFIASLSSCHMLWFLSLAARRGFVVDRYTDSAEGQMGQNASGKLWVARVVLRPHVVFGTAPNLPTDSDVEALHHAAHLECFIANSVMTAIETRSTWQV